jgi:hypothetical protein
MTIINPFDPDRDPALGALLRDALNPSGEDGFLRGLRAAIGATRQERTLDVLSRWLRPGIAAATVAAVLASYAWISVARHNIERGTTVAEMLVNDSPGHEVLLAGLMDAP